MYLPCCFAFSWTVINSLTDLLYKEKANYYFAILENIILWIQLRTFGSLCHTEFLLWKPTEQLSLMLYRNCFAVTSCVFCYSEPWVTELIVVCSLPWLLRCSEPFLTHIYIYIYIYIYNIYIHTHTRMQGLIVFVSDRRNVSFSHY